MAQATQLQEKAPQAGIKERGLLHLGGLAGMLGGGLFLLSAIALVSSSFSTSPSDPAALIAKFPDIRASVAAAESLDLLAVVTWVLLFVAIYRALRRTSPTFAIFGSVLGLLGLGMLLVGAMTFVAFDPISNLYHASGVTTATQNTLALTWQAIQGVFNETDTVGFFLMSIGFIILGLGMLKRSSFGKGFGGASLALGAAGVVGVSLFSITSSTFGVFGILVFVILPALLGWKVYRISRTSF